MTARIPRSRPGAMSALSPVSCECGSLSFGMSLRR
jgi:hypothetical protein